MVTKEDLMRNRRRRIMIYGPKGTGKTSSMVAAASDFVREGKVLYLDLGPEQGAIEELVNLDESVLAKIDYFQPRNYKEIMDKMVPGYKAVFVDALQNLRTIAAEVTSAALIAVGADNDGDDNKGVLRRLKMADGIAHPSVLGYGKGTGQMKEYERAMFDRLGDMGCDVVCACNTKSLSASENYVEILGGLFDVVLSMDRTRQQDGTYNYTFVIDKIRGVEFKDGSFHSFKKGENILHSVDDMTRPKPKATKKYSCVDCGHVDKPFAEIADCMKAGHKVN